MKLRLTLAALALFLVGAGARRPATVTAPCLSRRRTRTTGEVLLARAARAKCADREHHEADDRARRARARASSTTSSRSARRAARGRRVDDQPARRASGSPSATWSRRALIQSANDAAVALAELRRHGEPGALRRDDEREGAGSSACTTRTSRNPDGLDAPGHYSSARDVTRLAQIAMQQPGRSARSSASATATIAGGRTLTTWNDLLGRFPGLFGVKTGHTERRRLVRGRGGARPGVTIYATLLGEPDRATGATTTSRALLAWGLVAVPRRCRSSSASASTRPLRRLRARGRSRSSPRAATAVVRVGQPLVERVVAPTRLAARARGSGSGGARLPGRPAGRARAARRSRDGRAARILGRAGWYAGRTLHHVWQLGHARSRDRHRHPQRGDRPHADRAELPARPAPPRERRA